MREPPHMPAKYSSWRLAVRGGNLTRSLDYEREPPHLSARSSSWRFGMRGGNVTRSLDYVRESPHMPAKWTKYNSWTLRRALAHVSGVRLLKARRAQGNRTRSFGLWGKPLHMSASSTRYSSWTLTVRRQSHSISWTLRRALGLWGDPLHMSASSVRYSSWRLAMHRAIALDLLDSEESPYTCQRGMAPKDSPCGGQSHSISWTLRRAFGLWGDPLHMSAGSARYGSWRFAVRRAIALDFLDFEESPTCSAPTWRYRLRI